MTVHDDVLRVLITEDEIKERTVALGKELSEYYKDKNPLVIGILKGSIIFMGDLIRAIDIPLEYDFMDVSSYGGGTESSGEVKILKDLDSKVEDRHLLIVEDIIDTGRTLAYLVDMLKYRKAASVEIVTLLDKPSRRVQSIQPRWVGIEVPNEFVIGYGMDFDEQYRHLPYIGVLKPEKYQ